MIKVLCLAAFMVGCAVAASCQPSGAGSLDPSPGAPRVVFDSGTVGSADHQRGVLDVIWCRGDAQAEQRALRASELAGSFATVGRFAKLFEIADYAGVAVRTRSIDKLEVADKIKAIAGDAAEDLVSLGVFGLFDGSDPASRIVSEIVRKSQNDIALKSTRSFRTVKRQVSLSNYTVVYVCGGIDRSALTGHLYFQAKDSATKNKALPAINAVRQRYPGIAVSGKVEVLPTKSPKTSELRYFFEEDSATAQSLADIVSRTSEVQVTTKLIKGYESQLRPGSFEAWLTTTE